VLEGVPDLKALPRSTPWRIQELLEDCLQKEVNNRPHDVSHLRIQIKKALKEPVTASPTGVASAVQPVQQRWVLTVGLVVGAVVAGLAVWLLIQPTSPEQTLNRFIVSSSQTARLGNNFRNQIAVSPTGTHLVYVATTQNTTQLYVRAMNDVLLKPISGTEGGVQPFFFAGWSVGGILCLW